MQHEHLAVAVHARADADRGNLELLAGESADRRWDAFENDRERAGILQRERVVDQASRRARGLGLHLEAAELRDALRRETNVCHDGDAVRGERPDGVDDLRAALDLDRVHARLFEEARGVAKSVGSAGLVAAERHVADQQRTRRSARHGGGVADHVVHRHGHSRRIPEHDHAERVPDEDDVNARLIDEARERRVVRGHHRDALAVALHGDKVGDGDLLEGRRAGAAVLIAHL